MASSQDSVKESPFSAMIPPTSIPGTFMPSAIPGAGVFNPVGVQTQQTTNEKTPQSAEGMDAAAELTLQGEMMLGNGIWVVIKIIFNFQVICGGCIIAMFIAEVTSLYVYHHIGNRF